MKTLQIRLPDGLRNDADAVLSEMGLDLPTAVRLFLTKVVRTRSIPFALEAPAVRVEALAVDPETQTEMDGIANDWKLRNPSP